MPKRISIALCLSGGGFRATLFHLGVLKRLHELGLLARVRMLSAVSGGGAVTAALFHRHVDWPTYFGEANRYNKDDIFDRLEREGRPLAYDWETFEAQLLQATRAGILGPYVRSFGIWALLFWIAANWAFAWVCPLASLMALLATVILYRSLLPQTREYVRQRDCHEGLKEVDEHAESFFASRLPSRVRAFTLPLLPSMMRVTTLDALFDHEPCGLLHPTLFLYITAVELNRGRAMVFSNGVLAELGPEGSRDLWERRYYQDEKHSGRTSASTFNIKWLPIAEAVAASSALPPFFRPVVIRRGTGSLVGVFSDGGVVDNAALLAPIDMVIYCASFEETISDIFVVNAGKPASEVWSRWPWWPIMGVLRRIIYIITQGSQEVNVIQKFWLMGRQTGPNITAIAIEESEFPLEDGSVDNDIPYHIARIRTHFDAFDPIETATLVYSGYCQANRAFGKKAEAGKPFRSFRDVAREVTGAETVGNMSKDEIVRHLLFSSLRSSGVRKICRAVETVVERLRSAIG